MKRAKKVEVVIQDAEGKRQTIVMKNPVDWSLEFENPAVEVPSIGSSRLYEPSEHKFLTLRVHVDGRSKAETKIK